MGQWVYFVLKPEVVLDSAAPGFVVLGDPNARLY
jgi:hypothetical protein